MRGKPKYKLNDEVKFKLVDEPEYTGKIVIIDEYGTFENPDDVSYDILVEDYFGEPCLFKHITEHLVSKI